MFSFSVFVCDNNLIWFIITLFQPQQESQSQAKEPEPEPEPEPESEESDVGK